MASSMILGDKIVVGVAKLIRLSETIKPGSRSQITINDLKIINRTIDDVLSVIQDCVSVLGDTSDVSNLAIEFDSLHKFVDSLIDINIDCISYDDKITLSEKYNQARINLGVFAGRYLTNNDFTYALGKVQYLKYIVEICINNGYFFFN